MLKEEESKRDDPKSKALVARIKHLVEVDKLDPREARLKAKNEALVGIAAPTLNIREIVSLEAPKIYKVFIDRLGYWVAFGDITLEEQREAAEIKEPTANAKKMLYLMIRKADKKLKEEHFTRMPNAVATIILLHILRWQREQIKMDETGGAGA